MVLTDFSGTEFTIEGTANGVSGGIKTSAEKTVNGEGVGIFSVLSTGTSPRNGSWIKMEKKFEPWKDLEKNQALGVWLKEKMKFHFRAKDQRRQNHVYK